MKNIKSYQIWVAGISVFVVYRFLSGTLFSEGTIVSALLFILGFYFWVIPFVLGKEMSLVSYTDKFQKGQHDLIRSVLALTGLIGFVASLQVP